MLKVSRMFGETLNILPRYRSLLMIPTPLGNFKLGRVDCGPVAPQDCGPSGGPLRGAPHLLTQCMES